MCTQSSVIKSHDRKINAIVENLEMHFSFIRLFALFGLCMCARFLSHCTEVYCSLFLCHIFFIIIQFQSQMFQKLWIFSCFCAEYKRKICQLNFSLLWSHSTNLITQQYYYCYYNYYYYFFITIVPQVLLQHGMDQRILLGLGFYYLCYLKLF